MNRSFLPILTFFFVAVIGAPAIAESEVMACGIPYETTLNTDPHYQICNIYDRQLAYREKRLDFVRQIKERQHNFAEPYLELQRQYKSNLEALHESMPASTEN